MSEAEGKCESGGINMWLLERQSFRSTMCLYRDASRLFVPKIDRIPKLVGQRMPHLGFSMRRKVLALPLFLGSLHCSLRVSIMNDADMVIESELNDADMVIVRSRCNGDRFHVFDSIPLARNIPITPTVYQLLMTATFIKNKEEEEAVIEVRSKLGVTDFLLDEYMMKVPMAVEIFTEVAVSQQAFQFF
jgi:hypothetical protein